MTLNGLTQWMMDNFAGIFSEEFIIFLTSMIPFIELKGGLLAASIMEIPVWLSLPICFVANILPMPIAIWFFRAFLRWIKDKPGANKTLHICQHHL